MCHRDDGTCTRDRRQAVLSTYLENCVELAASSLEPVAPMAPAKGSWGVGPEKRPCSGSEAERDEAGAHEVGLASISALHSGLVCL